MDPQIAVIQASESVNDETLRAAISALQAQVHRDFAAAWGIDAHLSFVPRGSRPPAGAWWVVILDDCEQADVLGYHDVSDEGLPLGKVFARSSAAAGIPWTITASHELLEMLADPGIDLGVLVQDGDGDARLYAYEVCDACESSRHAYSIDGIPVCDFVFPTWFQPFRGPRSTQFDFRERIRAPLQLLEGGYASVLETGGSAGWVQQYADPIARRYTMRARVGSRRERRRTPRSLWLRSSVRFEP